MSALAGLRDKPSFGAWLHQSSQQTLLGVEIRLIMQTAFCESPLKVTRDV